MNILVTGATGFVGTALDRKLKLLPGLTVSAAVRKGCNFNPLQNVPTLPDCSGEPGVSKNLLNCEAVIHLAARVHRLTATDFHDEMIECRKVNTEGTVHFARQAATAGVKRFIFISSIKVNGELTQSNHQFTENSQPSPGDPYAISKYEAEQGLWDISRETGMEIVIIRPPLVYGPGVKANFLRMLQWLDRGIPLPLGGINNKRSLVALDNLVDFIWTCVEHPAAANQLFLVSDDHDLSTPELLHALTGPLGTPDRVFSFPPSLLQLAARVLRKSGEVNRLCDSLQVDISKAKDLLGWTPPVTVEDALKKTAEWYLNQKNKGAIS